MSGIRTHGWSIQQAVSCAAEPRDGPLSGHCHECVSACCRLCPLLLHIRWSNRLMFQCLRRLFVYADTQCTALMQHVHHCHGGALA